MLLNVVAQFTAKTKNSEKAIYCLCHLRLIQQIN